MRRYGYVLTGHEVFGLNLHLIDLRGVPEDEIHLCIQCNCKYLNNINNDNKTNSWFKIQSSDSVDIQTDWFSDTIRNGGAACCSGNKMCHSNLDEKHTLQYYFRYLHRF